MTPEMEAAAFDGLANNPAAQRHAEGRADDKTRARLLAARDAALDRDGVSDLDQQQSLVERVLGPRLRQAINDPSRHVTREAHEGFGDVATRAAIAAIVMGLFENDLHLITGERLAELEHAARQVQPSPLREDPPVLTTEEFEDLILNSGPPWGQGRGAYLAGLLGAKFREDHEAGGYTQTSTTGDTP